MYHWQSRLNKYKEGVPVDHRLLKGVCRGMGAIVPSKTEEIWRPLEEVGHLSVIDYIYREDGEGRSRRFPLSGRLPSSLTEGVEKDYEGYRYNLVTGSRTRATVQAGLTHDGEHSWSEHYGPCVSGGNLRLLDRPPSEKPPG